MAITRAKQSSLRTGVVKYDNLRAGLPFTPTIGTATDGGTGSTVSVAFTGNNTAGLTYTALSSPGSLTGTSTTSPITVSGLTSGTAYTFQVNAANSAGTSPYSAASNSVTPATPSSYESISSQTLGSSSSTVTFSSIPGTYKSLQIRAILRDTNATNSDYGFAIRVNSDTGSNYAFHNLYGDGTSPAAFSTASASRIISIFGAPLDGTTASTFGSTVIDIHDYASTTKNKTIRGFAGSNTNTTSTNFGVALFSGLWMSTSAVTSISIISEGTSFKSGSTFALYGIN
jgi:hypothetical protein